MSELKLVRRIAARPSIVFEALTTTEGMTSWFGPDDGPVLSLAADARVGGSFHVHFRKLDGQECKCTGEYLEIDAPHRIVMSYRWVFGGHPDEGEEVSRVEFHLRPIDTGTEVTLIHAELHGEDSARDHRWGWGGALDKLARRFASQPSC